MKKFCSIIFVILTFTCHVCSQAPGFEFTRTRLFSGFDGKMCKVLPCVATDWQGTILLTYTHLLLTGSDVFYGPYVTLSHDNGKTWSTPKQSITLSDTCDGHFRIVHNVVPRYSRKHSKWYALGGTFVYEDDKAPYKQMANGKPFRTPY